MPSLYVSATLERHRGAYYYALARVREKDDLLGWIVFFLDAVAETARTGCAKFKRIFALRDEMREYTRGLRGTAAAQRLLLHLYREPRVTAAAALECDYQSARRLVRRFVADGVLVPAEGSRRNAIYDFRRYLDLFKDWEVRLSSRAPSRLGPPAGRTALASSFSLFASPSGKPDDRSCREAALWTLRKCRMKRKERP